MVDKELAKLANTSPDTVHKVAKILAKATSEELNALRNDEDGFTIYGVYKNYYGKEKRVQPPPAPAKKSDPPSMKETATSKPSTLTQQDTSAAMAPLEHATPTPFTIEPSLPGLERDVDEMCFYFRDKIARCRQKEDRLYVLHRLQEFVEKIEAEWDKIKLPK